MREIPLTRGYVALVDDADYERVSQFKWTAMVSNKTVYGHRRGPHPRQEMILLHRFITKALPKMDIDHRDGNGLNCKRENLRMCTHKQNTYNAQRRSDNVSGFKGVHWHHKNQKWRAQIQGKHIGMYATAEEAAHAYDAAALKHFGEFARLNFPPKAA